MLDLHYNGLHLLRKRQEPQHAIVIGRGLPTPVAVAGGNVKETIGTLYHIAQPTVCLIDEDF